MKVAIFVILLFSSTSFAAKGSRVPKRERSAAKVKGAKPERSGGLRKAKPVKVMKAQGRSGQREWKKGSKFSNDHSDHKGLFNVPATSPEKKKENRKQSGKKALKESAIELLPAINEVEKSLSLSYQYSGVTGGVSMPEVPIKESLVTSPTEAIVAIAEDEKTATKASVVSEPSTTVMPTVQTPPTETATTTVTTPVSMTAAATTTAAINIITTNATTTVTELEGTAREVDEIQIVAQEMSNSGAIAFPLWFGSALGLASTILWSSGSV